MDIFNPIGFDDSLCCICNKKGDKVMKTLVERMTKVNKEIDTRAEELFKLQEEFRESSKKLILSEIESYFKEANSLSVEEQKAMLDEFVASNLDRDFKDMILSVMMENSIRTLIGAGISEILS